MLVLFAENVEDDVISTMAFGLRNRSSGALTLMFCDGKVNGGSQFEGSLHLTASFLKRTLIRSIR